jgi:hypothetical protein
MLSGGRTGTLTVGLNKENVVGAGGRKFRERIENFGYLGHAPFCFFVKNFLTKKEK